MNDGMTESHFGVRCGTSGLPFIILRSLRIISFEAHIKEPPSLNGGGRVARRSFSEEYCFLFVAWLLSDMR